jgi:hypothetical protein
MQQPFTANAKVRVNFFFKYTTRMQRKAHLNDIANIQTFKLMSLKKKINSYSKLSFSEDFYF